ncbi:MAG: cobalamin-dependent protein [Polyangiaceae bacterium]|nr:cobalamin-dependent protein [Polyangiaceae bacterium]
MLVRLPEDGATFYVREPDAGRHAPERGRTVTAAGEVLTRRRHGYAARVHVQDDSPEAQVACWLRAAAAVGRAAELSGLGSSGFVRVTLRDAESGIETDADGHERLVLDARVVRGSPVHHPVDALARGLVAGLRLESPRAPTSGGPAARRVLFFESLMNTDMPHNDGEISQGVLHMASTLAGSGTEVVLANVKMSIVGDARPVLGMSELERVLARGPIDLVCITLLEGYFDGVEALITELRRLGCRAHIAVGGVMPTLTPEHVAAHLADVTFVCRGAGEYFVPRLSAIVGQADVSAPFGASQVHALLAMDGLLTLDRAGKALIASNPGRTVSVEDLDRVPLDLSLLERRHLQQGVELSTSRGCIHKCAFCSIIGRQSYQARSAEGVFELLARYQRRYAELFGDDVPNNAFRLHLSDDDFACDRARAASFFRGLVRTPFRLASVQVSIADLCLLDGTRLLPEVDPLLVDALSPECFADSGAPIPERDFVADHKSRRWSAYLQIGVETFSQRELTRLGKGYDIAHVRRVVQVMAQKQIHVDAYLILANADTSASDVLESLSELCRLKLAHPRWFHVRFPIVPRLVSYFPSASHRRLVRQGRSEVMRVRRHARTAGYAEFDYPFVDHDEPDDLWVRDVDESIFTDQDCYTATLTRLRELWLRRWSAHESERTLDRERLLRVLDDLPRRLVFQRLCRARERVLGPERGTADEERQALATAERLLGPRQQWLLPFKRAAQQTAPRLVVIPTWQCELRCKYCYIPKQDGRVMTPELLDRSLELLLSSDRDAVMLQFFGGEALTEWALVQRGIERGTARARELGKRISFILSSNGWSLDEQKLDWLRDRPVKLELSLDGDRAVQNHARPASLRMLDSYEFGIAPRADAILSSGLANEVIMVVLPHNVERMPDSFFHIQSLGFRRIQINFALGVMWTAKHQRCFADGLFRIGEELRRRWDQGEELMLVNLEAPPCPVLLNGELTVDYDGTIYSGNGFLHENEHKASLRVGHLDELGSFDRLWFDLPDNDYLLSHGYPADVTANNRKVGQIMASFVRHMQRSLPRRQRPPAAAAGGASAGH